MEHARKIIPGPLGSPRRVEGASGRTARTFLVGVAIAALGAAACASDVVLTAGGAQWPVSSAEADVARRYEEAAPLTGARARCDYWMGKAGEVTSGKHASTALGGMVRMNNLGNSPNLIAWAQAREGEACAAVATEAKGRADAVAADAQRKADEYAAAAPQREAQLVEARRQARADAEARAERRRAATQAEVASGRCSDAHHATLERALATLKPLLEGSSGSDAWVFVEQYYLVAVDAGHPLSFSARMRGDYQILLLGTGTAELEVRDDQGYPASRRSDRAAATLEALADGFARDTRAVQASAGAKLQVTVKGAGCSLVMAFAAF